VSMSSSCSMEQHRNLHSGNGVRPRLFARRAAASHAVAFLPAGAASPAVTQACQTGQGTQRVVGFFHNHADELRFCHGHRIASHICEVTDFKLVQRQERGRDSF